LAYPGRAFERAGLSELSNMFAFPRCPQRQPVATLVAAFALALPLAACGQAPDRAETAPAASRIAVSHGWSRETAPGQDAGGAFLTIVNEGTVPDRLLGGTAPAAQDVQIHTVDMTGGVMRMRQLAKGLEIPAGGTVTLAPGGNHIMLMGLKRPLAQGETVPLTLEFEKAGDIGVELTVQPIGAEGPEEEAHHG